MEIGDLSKPGEKKKLIGAGVLGLVAIIFLWWTFVGFGSSSTPTTSRQAPTQPTRRGTAPAAAPDQSQQLSELTNELSEVRLVAVNTNVPEPKRNIFAFYQPPVITTAAETPTPTPTPTPPLLLASVAPSNVYARTGDFALEASGDKFTSDVRIFMDGRELPTKFKSRGSRYCGPLNGWSGLLEFGIAQRRATAGSELHVHWAYQYAYSCRYRFVTGSDQQEHPQCTARRRA